MIRSHRHDEEEEEPLSTALPSILGLGLGPINGGWCPDPVLERF
jgi:hypothetical protein